MAKRGALKLGVRVPKWFRTACVAALTVTMVVGVLGATGARSHYSPVGLVLASAVSAGVCGDGQVEATLCYCVSDVAPMCYTTTAFERRAAPLTRSWSQDSQPRQAFTELPVEPPRA